METRTMFIVESITKDGRSRSYSVSAESKEDCLAIFEDYKDEGEEFVKIREELTRSQYTRDILK